MYVAITCARDSVATGRPCPPCPALEDRIPAGDATAWYAAAIAEHGWTLDADDNAWCPRHNPGDAGATVTLREGEYRALGDSGWEARLPGDYTGSVDIEIRQKRGGDA